MNRTIAWAVMLAVLVGCSKSEPAPKSLSEARNVAMASRDAAKVARESKAPRVAAKALRRAQAASDFAKEVLAAPSVSPADNALCNETFTAVKETRLIADLAEEDERLATLVTGLKARAYRTARGAACKVVFCSLALAARNAEKGDNAILAEQTKPAADLAVQLSGYCGRGSSADNNVNWAGVASDMDAMATRLPDNVTLGLAVGLLVLQKNAYAL